MKLICPVSGAGLYISAYAGKELRILFILELAGDLILTFYKTEGAFTQVVGDGDGEISDP